jgi:hypothetical protein
VSAAWVGDEVAVGDGVMVDVAVTFGVEVDVDVGVDVGVALAGRLQAASINIKTGIRLVVRGSRFMCFPFRCISAWLLL